MEKTKIKKKDKNKNKNHLYVEEIGQRNPLNFVPELDSMSIPYWKNLIITKASVFKE